MSTRRYQQEEDEDEDDIGDQTSLVSHKASHIRRANSNSCICQLAIYRSSEPDLCFRRTQISSARNENPADIKLLGFYLVLRLVLRCG